MLGFLIFFFFYYLILLKIWSRVQGIARTRKNFLQCQKFFPPWAVSGNDVPGMFSWDTPGGKALSSAERERTGGRKLDIA